MPAPRVLVITPKLHERFWAKVNYNGPIAPGMDDPCWLWTAGTLPGGYGVIEVKLEDGRWVAELAHRVAWALTRGSLSPVCVCHDCDVRSCVRPSHLWEGTDAENIADRDEKGRQARGAAVVPATRPRGSAHYATHLTEDDVREIRRLVSIGDRTQRSIAAEYKIKPCTVGAIIEFRTWKHVK